MEQKLIQKRQTFVVDIRKDNMSTFLHHNRQKRLHNIANYSFAQIIKGFPESIFELKNILTESGQRQYILNQVEQNFDQMFEKVDFENTEMVNIWSEILDIVFRDRFSVQTMFLEKWFEVLADKCCSRNLYNSFFGPLMSINLQDLSKQQCMSIVKIVKHNFQFITQDKYRQQTMTMSQIMKGKQNTIVFRFLLRVISLYNQYNEVYEGIFKILICSQTISILKKIICSGKYNNHNRCDALIIFTNLFINQHLSEDYYFLLFQDDMLIRLKYICEFGNFQQRTITWKLIFNIFSEPDHRQRVLESGYMDIAMDLILNHKQDTRSLERSANPFSKQKIKIYSEVSSLYICFFQCAVDDDQISFFVQNGGLQVVTSMLKNYVDIESIFVQVLLASLVNFMKLINHQHEKGQHPFIIKLKQQKTIWYLLKITEDKNTNNCQKIQQILDIFGEISKK